MSPTYTTCLHNKNTNHVTLMWGECFTHNLTNSGLGETSCFTADERIAAHHGQANLRWSSGSVASLAIHANDGAPAVAAFCQH